MRRSSAARRVAERVVLRRCLRQAGDQGRLVQGEVLRVLREVGHGRRLDPDRRPALVGAVRNGVQVLAQDPVLPGPARVLVLELLGQLRLADLALEVPLRVLDVERAHELLRDRRAALNGVAARLQVLDARADDRRVVHALVLVEALVLDRDGGLADLLGHLAPRDRRTDLVGAHVAQAGAVSRVHHGGRALVARLELGQGRRVRRDRDHVADRGQEHCPQDEQRDEDDQQRGVAPPASSSPATSLPLAVGHSGVKARPSLLSFSRVDARTLAATSPRSRALAAQVATVSMMPSFSIWATSTS